jgi:capsular polysaccharide biosynthesis protein
MLKNLKNRILKPLVNTAKPKFCDHILDRALFEKWTVQKTHEPFILDLPIPTGCESDPFVKKAYSMHKRTGFQAQYLVGIPNGVAAGAGFVRLSTGEFLTESSWRTSSFFGPHGRDFSCARYRRHKIYLKGDCYYMDMIWSGNYGHWLSDEIPRLMAALPFLPSSTRFIVSDPCQEYKIQTLAAIGISRDRLIPVKNYIEAHCERLWFATPLGHSEWASTSPSVFKKLRDNLLEAYGQCEGPTPERIFVSRNKTKQRRLINEHELIKTIQEFEFTIVHPQELSMPQQIQLFSKAKVVLGAYGAGLTNILFSPFSAQFLELQDSTYAPRMWYWKLATMLGHSYSTLVGLTKISRYDVDTDFEINPESLQEFLKLSLDTQCQGFSRYMTSR